MSGARKDTAIGNQGGNMRRGPLDSTLTSLVYSSQVDGITGAQMFTTEERRDTLGRERGRLARAYKKPWTRGYIKDKRIIVDALEALVTLNFAKGDKGHAKDKAEG